MTFLYTAGGPLPIVICHHCRSYAVGNPIRCLICGGNIADNTPTVYVPAPSVSWARAWKDRAKKYREQASNNWKITKLMVKAYGQPCPKCRPEMTLEDPR